MTLLLQLNSSLEDEFPGHERRIYILSCRRKTCWRKPGCIRAVRANKIDTAIAQKAKLKVANEDKEEPSPKRPVNIAGIGNSLFGGSSNPFSVPVAPAANPFSTSKARTEIAESAAEIKSKTVAADSSDAKLTRTFASTFSINTARAKGPTTPKEPWPTTLPPPYPCLYFNEVSYEELDASTLPAVTKVEPVDYGFDNGTVASDTNAQEDKDVFESELDTTFQRFADRLAHNPTQTIRYEFRGQPLLYNKTDEVGRLLAPVKQDGKIAVSSKATNRMPSCSSCGAPRVFEVQMTPHAISELEGGDVSDLIDGMEWGTLIVGVCEKDCTTSPAAPGEVSYAEEWVGVQWEEQSSNVR
jgi:pre-rRNA-processing protein TSR4